MNSSSLDTVEPAIGPLNMGDAPVLFYTSIRHIFRSILIGHLYQVCKKRKVVLITEELDSEIDALLSDRNLFPGLISQVKIGQYERTGEGIIARQRKLSNLALDIIETWRPSVVFAPGVDLFQHYLRRYAKQKIGALTIDCIGWLGVRKAREISLLSDLHTAGTRFPAWLPQGLRLALARSQRWLAQFAYYDLTPLAAGRVPFFGVNGIYRLDYTRLGHADVSFVFTRANQKMLISEGAPADRIRVIPHPMKSGLPDEFWCASGFYSSNLKKKHPRVLTCFIDIMTNWGFTRNNLDPIPDKALYASRIEAIETVAAALPGWEVRIKPHPMSPSSQNYETVHRALSTVSDRVVWVSPDEPAEDHILSSDAIVGFPPASASLYSAAIMRPDIPVLMVDVNRELRGDGLIGVEGVVTVSSLQELNEQIRAVADGVWRVCTRTHEHPDFETLEQLLTLFLPSTVLDSDE